MREGARSELFDEEFASKFCHESSKRHSAIDQMGLSGNIACLVGSEKNGERRDFFGG